MTVTLAASSPSRFDIKSAQLPLVALRVKSARLDLVADELAAQYADVPDFFDNDPLLIDFSLVSADESQTSAPTPIEFEALLQVARALKLRPVAVRGGQAAYAALAQQAGLVVAEDVLPGARSVHSVQKPVENTSEETVVKAETPEAERQLASQGSHPGPQVAGNPSALIIDKPLRSGQQV